MWLDRHQTYLSWAGLVSAFILCVSFLIAAALLIEAGHDAGGTILGTVDLVALATVFVTRQRK